MSVKSPLFISLCLFMHACSARHLAGSDKGFAKQHFSGKVVEKVELGSNSIAKGARNGGMLARNHGCANNTPKPKELKAYYHKDIKILKEENSGVIPIKKSNEHPGFYLDYSQPRTRPPTHN